MSETAPDFDQEEPSLDLDAMLADLHNDFPDPEVSADLEGAGEEAPGGEVETTSSTEPPSLPDTPDILPPGLVDFGGEIMPIEEAQALLELNRQVKGDPDKAKRVRDAILGQQVAVDVTDSLPEWLDPDDQQSIFLYRQQQRIDAELSEVKAAESRRQADYANQQAETRKQLVINSFRDALSQFHVEHPEFDTEDVKNIVAAASDMRLLETPESLDPEGSLKGGMMRALDTAVWATPQYREKTLHSDTLRSKAQQAEDRKRKQSALSSSTGSTPRNQTSEPRPNNRQEIMSAMLTDFRSGLTE